MPMAMPHTRPNQEVKKSTVLSYFASRLDCLILTTPRGGAARMFSQNPEEAKIQTPNNSARTQPTVSRWPAWSKNLRATPV